MFSHQELINELPALRKFAYKLSNSPDDAEDLLHSTVVRALEKQEQFSQGTNLFSWGSKIMYHKFVSNYRRKAKFESQYDPEPYIQKQFVKSRQEKRTEIREIEEAMQNLSQEHQEILALVCVKEMKYKEVSKILGIPIGTVRSRLSRARQELSESIH